MPKLLFQFQRDNKSKKGPTLENLSNIFKQRKISYDKIQKNDDDTVAVEFRNPEDAKKAFKSLDGIELIGAHLTIKPSKNKNGNYRRGESGQKDYNNQIENVYGNPDYNEQKNSDNMEQPQYNGHYNMIQQSQINVDQYPCRILIPSDMVKVVLGKAGSTINDIQTKTNTKIDIHRDKSAARSRQQENTLITIKGDPRSFSEAIKEILTVINAEMEKQDSEERKPLQLKLFAHDLLCGRIIGKAGNNLKQLKHDTGVSKLIISNSLYEDQHLPGGMLCMGERVITIEGTVKTISAAEEQLSKKLRDYMDRDIKHSGNSGFVNMAGTHYGSGGLNNGYVSYLPQMMYQRPYYYPNQCVYMGFPSYPGYMGPAYPGILGHGYPPYGGNLIPQPQNNEAVSTICIIIPTKDVGAIIGRNGDYISRVKGYSGAQLRVVKGEEGGESRVEITGIPDSQWRASLCVFSKIKETMKVPYSEAQLKTEYMVPGACVGRIIGKKGQVVQDIQDKAQADIEVPKDRQGGNDVPVFITGTFNGTQLALNRIREIVHRASTKTT